MTSFLNKLFTGASSSASNTDLGSMETLSTAINNLANETGEKAGERAAEIVRQNKDLLERKSSEVEHFLLSCNPNVGSAAMVAAIKGLFDSSSSKGHDLGLERAVELLHHYLDANVLNGEHLRLVPDVIFPLLRNIGTYCLEKKHKPEIGQKIISKGLETVYPRDGSLNVLTSAHSVLFACALKTKDYVSVEQFIDTHIEAVANERCVDESVNNDDHGSILGIARFKKAQLSSLGASSSNSYVSPKFVLDYLYNGACVLIELRKYEEALFLLETLITIPSFSVQDQLVEGYKKFVLVSLLLNGRVAEHNEKQVSTRNFKAKATEYKPLAEVKFARSANTHAKVEELIHSARDKLRRDGNLELAKLLVVEMKKKTIIALVKIFSSVQLADIQKLSFLKNRTQVTDIIEQLVSENKITVNVEGEMVFWSEVAPVPSKADILAKIVTVDTLNAFLEDRNKQMKSGGKGMKQSVLFNDDEGLSMPPIE